jgi:CO/xanthine dehydrogenase Mo-binding subunit
VIATLHDPTVIRKILAHLGFAPSGPSPGPTPPAPGAGAIPAAIGNAVFDATGVRLRSLPFTPDKVKAALAQGPARA